MKKLIKINEEHYIIIDDSKHPERGEYCYSKERGLEICLSEDFGWKNPAFKYKASYVTHSTDININELYYIPLSEVEEVINDYNVHQLAFNYMMQLEKIKPEAYKLNPSNYYEGFKKGFKAHQELVKNNLFSLEFLTWIDKEEVTYKDGSWIKYFDGKDNYLSIKELYSYYKSLLPKTEWEVEFDENNKITLL